MADFSTHLLQAEHNGEVALKLSKEAPYHDWAVTAAFYSAIHFFEAWLFHRKERHTETSIPILPGGDLKYSVHTWREKLIQSNLSRDALKAFRLLRESSETSRYLTLYRMGSGTTPQWIPKGAWDYIPQPQAQALVEKDLALLRKALRVDLIEYLYKLNLPSRLGITFELMASKIIADFTTREELLGLTLRQVEAKYGNAVVKALAEGAAAIGDAFAPEET